MSNKYEPTVMSHPCSHSRKLLPDDGTSESWPMWMVDMLREWCASPSRPSLAKMAAQINADARYDLTTPKTRNAVLGKIHRLGLGDRVAYVSPSQGKPYQSQSAIEWTEQADHIIRCMPKSPSGVIAKMIEQETGLPVNSQHVRYRRSLIGVATVKQFSKVGSRGKAVAVRAYPFSADRARRKADYKTIPKDGPLPSTCVDVFEADRSTCMFPLNSDVRDLKVCGSKATIGSYCDHHARLAYREMPTASRNRAYHRRNEFDREAS